MAVEQIVLGRDEIEKEIAELDEAWEKQSEEMKAHFNQLLGGYQNSRNLLERLLLRFEEVEPEGPKDE